MKKILFLNIPPVDINSNNTFELLFRNFFLENKDYEGFYVSCRDGNNQTKTFSHVYCLSERRTFHSIFHPHVDCFSECGLAANTPKKSIYGKKLFFRNMGRFARDIIWSISHWKKSSFSNFLKSNDFSYVVASSEGSLYYLDILSFVLKNSNAKLVLFHWDDNFSFKQCQLSPLFYLYRIFLRSKFRKIRSFIYRSFAITLKTKSEADGFFHSNSIVINKTPLFINCHPVSLPQPPLKMVFGGNLQNGRDKEIIRLAKIINNKYLYNKIQLFIYSDSLTKNDLKRLSALKNVQTSKSIPYSSLIQVEMGCDISLLVESLEWNKAEISRLSFSTKVTDYLGVGNCILSIAKKNTATSEYLLKNNFGYVASSGQELSKLLRSFCDNPQLIRRVSENIRRVQKDICDKKTTTSTLESCFCVEH
jgi:hypothetical protein